MRFQYGPIEQSVNILFSVCSRQGDVRQKLKLKQQQPQQKDGPKTQGDIRAPKIGVVPGLWLFCKGRKYEEKGFRKGCSIALYTEGQYCPPFQQLRSAFGDETMGCSLLLCKSTLETVLN